MEKKETYKAPEMRSVILIKEGVMQQTSVTSGTAGQIETVNDYTKGDDF